MSVWDGLIMGTSVGFAFGFILCNEMFGTAAQRRRRKAGR